MTTELRARLADAQALVFDFDGTMAPNLDLPDMKRQVIALTLAHQVPESVFAGAMIVEIIQQAAAWLGATDATAATGYQAEAQDLITDIELNAAANTNVYPETRSLLLHWRAQKRLSAIVTRNCRAAVLGTYPQVLDEVDALLARDDVSHLKPDQRHLQQALNTLAVSGASAIMVGDGRMDMQIGRALGLFCVGVLGGSSDRLSLQQAGAHCVLSHISDLATTLHSL